MINTVVFKPDFQLCDYISFFAVREFDAFDAPLLKPMCAKEEIHMMFLIRSKMTNVINSPDQPSRYHTDPSGGPEAVFSGLLTAYSGTIVFNGHIKLLTIHFKPTGFYGLFGTSPVELTDRLGNSSDLCYREILQLQEQIQNARTNAEIFQMTASCMISILGVRKRIRSTPALLKVTEFLISNRNVVSVEELAYSSNMSLKTFERKFVEQVGVSPKLFSRLRRFNQALELKMNQPEASWTSIGYHAGYYDQNHFIKNFTAFAGKPPTQFFKTSPPPAEHVSRTVGRR
jgi:methylphosphotriester-DNA--protein-cysteine methyltransferase